MTVPVEILFIEDYEPDVQFLFLLLKRHRISNKVHVINNGAEALDFIFCRDKHANRASEPLPAAIFLDIRIPKVDGFEILQQVKENPQTTHIPVIMMSGSTFPEQSERCKILGASACIQKPVKFEDLCSIFNQAGFSWLLIEHELVS
ncbi:response regulator [Pedosphaera parvula]|uniref:Response regulator receiver protein n=1 Tax=Pedosphaera parvula (strain Ellin514) TaxID=320771 RepID=B9XE66_PEDPL|nr:response regulator [Pedosphaera parvula]EEF61957.1 response regulator receiver protein [Pedosphaera parvula Ellin514]